MSTYLKTANISSTILTYKIIQDTRLSQVAIIDVTQGSGSLRTIEYDALNNTGGQRLKLKLTTTEVVVGTTVPDIVVEVEPTKKGIIEFPGGLSFTGLSAWLVSGLDDAAATNTENAAGRYTTIRFVTT